MCCCASFECASGKYNETKTLVSAYTLKTGRAPQSVDLHPGDSACRIPSRPGLRNQANPWVRDESAEERCRQSSDCAREVRLSCQTEATPSTVECLEAREGLSSALHKTCHIMWHMSTFSRIGRTLESAGYPGSCTRSAGRNRQTGKFVLSFLAFL